MDKSPVLPENAPLGQDTTYPGSYDPSLLCPIPRAPARDALGLSAGLPFVGEDRWSAYELSWLNPRGKPEVAIGVFTLPYDSPAIIESKSFKLYLNSLNQTVFANTDALMACLARDLGEAAGDMVSITLQPLTSLPCDSFRVETIDGICLDTLDVAVDSYQPKPELLAVKQKPAVSERLYSHLLKSNCPVTAQPDWATVLIEYEGKPIDHGGLLQYIISFREHQDFHENCVERIFNDIWRHCEPRFLSVYARYTRRGGLDINPWRTSDLSKAQLAQHMLRQQRQ